MSRTSSATLNYQLTAFAQGLMNDLEASMELARRLAPLCPVPGASGQYKKFDDKNSFQIYNTARAMGGDPTRIEFGASDGRFNCEPQALEVTVDKAERQQVGQDNAIGQELLDQGKIKALLNVSSLAHVKKVVDKVLASVNAVADRGQWSNPDIDPIDQLDEQLDELSKGVGSTQNIKLNLDVTAWRTIRNHPKVKARVNGAQATPISRQQLIDSLCIPVDLGVYSIVYNQAPLGKAQAKARLLASTVLMNYSIPNPTQYDPSAFKTFVTGGMNQIMAVRSYQAPNGFYDGHVVDWSEEINQTSALAIRRIDLS